MGKIHIAWLCLVFTQACQGEEEQHGYMYMYSFDRQIRFRHFTIIILDNICRYSGQWQIKIRWKNKLISTIFSFNISRLSSVDAVVVAACFLFLLQCFQEISLQNVFIYSIFFHQWKTCFSFICFRDTSVSAHWSGWNPTTQRIHFEDGQCESIQKWDKCINVFYDVEVTSGIKRMNINFMQFVYRHIKASPIFISTHCFQKEMCALFTVNMKFQ